ncbi:MAG: hypothetical protein EBU84_01785 [Actinobacteria bacterium]|nr:hypothetical protein [Actinomycetota bacterium]
MSTRSIIAKQHGDTWIGRYAHWDGYPSHQGASIWQIVQRDGYETATRVLVDDNFYWSQLDPWRSADTNLNMGMDDGRFVNVAGYGVAGTTEQAQPDEWYSPENYKESWCEYVYVISKAGLLVIRIYDEMPLGFFRWDEPEPNWEDVQNTPEAAEA